MIYYIDSNNERHGLEEDGSQDFLIKEDWVKIDPSVMEEELEKLNPNSLENTRNRLLMEVNKNTSNVIISGFISQALGEDNYYKSTTIDQNNLSKIVISGIASKYQISKDNINFTEVEHTAKQLKQVNTDMVKHITSTLSKGREIKELINSATTVEELNSLDINI